MTYRLEAVLWCLIFSDALKCRCFFGVVHVASPLLQFFKIKLYQRTNSIEMCSLNDGLDLDYIGILSHWSATVMTSLGNIVSWMLSKDL